MSLAGKVTSDLVESNGSLPLGLWSCVVHAQSNIGLHLRCWRSLVSVGSRCSL